MLSLDELVSVLSVEKTVLLLGAGASIPSGAPSGVELARHVSHALAGDVVSDDFVEAASILEYRYGREAVVREVRGALKPLTPTGGLLTLAYLPWPEIYTTNFDRLIEKSFRLAQRRVVPVRSNFEYARPDTEDGIPLYKIHGCISQDIVDGHRAGMALTEADYATYADYRETLFKALELALTTKDVVVVGQSLRDPHLRQLLVHTAELRSKRGAPGRAFGLVYETDHDRAGLMEARGLDVTFAGIDEFMHLLAEKAPQPASADVALEADRLLPVRLLAGTVDALHASQLEPNAIRLFNGGPASFADIKARLTFPRDSEQRLLQAIRNPRHVATTILGVAGVGKTTMARRILTQLSDEGFAIWEHRTQFPLLRVGWLEVERRLREAGRRGALMVDDCPKFLNQINKLVDVLAERDEVSLHVLVTGNLNEWRPRIKAPLFFRRGSVETLSQLSGGEIERLLNLVHSEPQIGRLVERGFASKPRQEQSEVLRRRCRADMFVCLKNIFASEGLDDILLREFASLASELQDIYRHVAVLEATGAQVHRQLIIRLLGIAPSTVAALLELMEGIVDEFDIDPNDGLFGWSTRHPVIAQTIARYKYADPVERLDFMVRTIDASNPSVRIEREMLREMCSREYGILSLPDLSERERLLRLIIARAPSERVPRHRLVAVLLDKGEFESADRELEVARDEVGWDPPLARYRVRTALQRARQTAGILDEDRRAILLQAERMADDGIERFPDDKYAYRSLLDVGAELARLTGDAYLLESAYRRMRDAYDRLLDPELAEILQNAYGELRRYGY